MGYQIRSARARDAGPVAVDQDQVEVAAGGQLLAAVAADRDERDVGLGAEQPGEVAVELLRCGGRAPRAAPHARR